MKRTKKNLQRSKTSKIQIRVGNSGGQHNQVQNVWTVPKWCVENKKKWIWHMFRKHESYRINNEQGDNWENNRVQIVEFRVLGILWREMRSWDELMMLKLRTNNIQSSWNWMDHLYKEQWVTRMLKMQSWKYFSKWKWADEKLNSH